MPLLSVSYESGLQDQQHGNACHSTSLNMVLHYLMQKPINDD